MTQPTPEQPQQIQIPMECAPREIPLAWHVAADPVQGLIGITLFDCTGQRMIILRPEHAQRFIDEIAANLPSARTGLVIP